uniref:AlNc14C519G12026 protein n=1 Tax=Albugo laibachii Nc14 TaxID=890382 RepID=F0X0T2_9STRA|nr:AlNc14C519G12026 [Albugo laibachii Nc14]|eukprot:CCA27376.1 AlNc14C519G12026 [Albugo laibachii Nc14]
MISLSMMNATTKHRKKSLTDSERTGIMCTHIQCAGGSAKVSRTDIESVALAYACSPKTIMRVWKRGRDTMDISSDLLDVQSRIEGKKGKERIDIGVVQKKMEAAPYLKRYKLRSLACVTGVSASTLCRMRKRNDIKTTTNTIKPF